MNPRQGLWRRGILVLALAFVVYVGLSIRPSGARTKELSGQVAETLAKEAEGIRDRLRFRDFVYDESRVDGATFRIRASEAIAFSSEGDEVYRLKDVHFETPKGEGRPALALMAPRAEFHAGTKALRVFDGVTLEGEALSLRSASFRFEPSRREFLSEGPVTMVRGRLLATAEKGILETEGGRVRMEGKVRMAGHAEDGRFLRMAAAMLLLRRDGSLLAKGEVMVQTLDSILRSESVERVPDGEGDRLRATGPTTLSLEVRRQGGVSGPVAVSGTFLDLARDAAGLPLSLTLSAEGDAVVLAAPSDGAGPRRAMAPRFEASFVAGELRTVHAPAGMRGSEAVPGDGQKGTGLRTVSASAARFTLLPGGAELDLAYLDGDVALADGSRATLHASKGTLRGVDQMAVFSGETGRPARYEEESGSIRAQLLTWFRKQERVDASGEVRTTFRGGRGGLPGSSDAEPSYSESDTLRMSTPDRVVTLTGHVRAWQKENVLRCGTLVLNDADRTARAERDVRTVFRRKGQGAGTSGKGGSETVTASGDVLTHREKERSLRIEGNSSILSGSWSMKATVTDIRMAKDQSVESAEARGTVVLEDRSTGRRGEGSRATWKPDSETVTLEGAPATALDGKGNRLTGARLTFRQGRSRVDVESGTGVQSEGSFRPEGP